jgi:RND family efflux transporter MFP subunit
MPYRIFSIQLVVLAVFAFASAGCGPDETDDASTTPAKKPASEFETGLVTAKSYVEKIELPGASVHGFEKTQLMAKVGGYVKEIKSISGEEIDIGTLVVKGDALAILDVPEMQDQLAEKDALVRQAESMVAQADAIIKQREAGITLRKAEVKQAKANLAEKEALLKFSLAKKKRIGGLVKQGTIGAENLDEVQFSVDAANAAILAGNADVETADAEVAASKADLEKAKADKVSAEEHVKVAEANVAELNTLIGYATIEAPFDGIVTKRFVDHGAFVRPASNSGAMPLFEITRIDMVRVTVAVPNVETARIRSGQKTIVHSIGGAPGVRIGGDVTRMSQALDPTSRMMHIEVHFKNPLKQPGSDRTVFLQPGMFGSVTVIVKEWDDLPVVPVGAVQTDSNGQAYVFVVGTDRIAKRQDVEIVFNDAVFVGLRSGVKPGKIVVTKNAAGVKDGQSIPANSE